MTFPVLPEELELAIWDMVRMNIRPFLKRRLWKNVHTQLCNVIEKPEDIHTTTEPSEEVWPALYNVTQPHSFFVQLAEISREDFMYEDLRQMIEDYIQNR